MIIIPCLRLPHPHHCRRPGVPVVHRIIIVDVHPRAWRRVVRPSARRRLPNKKTN